MDPWLVSLISDGELVSDPLAGCDSQEYSCFFGHSLGDSVLIWSRIYEFRKPVLLSQCVATID